MKRLTPLETNYHIWVSDLVADTGKIRPQLHEVLAAESAHIPCTRSLMEEPHTHEEHEIILILAGTGSNVLDDGRTYTASAGQIVVIPGGQSHKLIVEDRMMLRGLYIHPTLCRKLASSGADTEMATSLGQFYHPLAPRVITDAHLFRSLQDLFDQSQAEYGHDDPWRALSLEAVGRLVAINLMRAMRMKEQPHHADATMQRVASVKAWMDRHFLDQVTLAHLAEMAHLSPSHFSAMFRQLAGISPKAYVIQRRLNRAAWLLSETDLSITEIAISSGFEHLAHFSRLFSEHTGMAPLAYRRKDQKDQQN